MSARLAHFPRPDHYAIAPTAEPEAVRNILLALYELRSRLRRIRVEMDWDDAPLCERFAAGRVAQELDRGIANARAFLTAVARRGGRGFAPNPKPAAAARFERQRDRSDVEGAP